MNRRATLLSMVFILVLIVYDTLQQKYYVDTFLSSKANYLELLGRHSLSWLVWVVVGLPFFIVVNKWMTKNFDALDVIKNFRLLTIILLHITVSLGVMTIIRILERDIVMAQFIELLTFNMFQKTMVFFMADCTVIILLFSMAREKVIQSQYVEIKHLSEQSLVTEQPQMVIKTGNRIDQVLLSDIIWIQSDDYCSKIHATEDRNFSIRKSLKSLEESLKPYGFVRIHRSVLLNLINVSQFNLDKSIVTLKNDLQLPVSKSRVRSLRESLSRISV